MAELRQAVGLFICLNYGTRWFMEERLALVVSLMYRESNSSSWTNNASRNPFSYVCRYFAIVICSSQSTFFCTKNRRDMADNNLKKLSRAELLEMMISFSEEAEAAKKHEQEYKEELEKEKAVLQHEMAEERARMLESFDDEKAEMRAKFAEQKAEMQAKFDKDINGLKARLERELAAKDAEVDKKLKAIEKSGTLAEAVLNITGMMEDAQKAIDMFKEQMEERK